MPESSATIPPEKSSTDSVTRTHTPSPPVEAAKHVDGCKNGEPSACHAAGLDAYYQPPSPATDQTALENFKKACAAGYAPSCSGLGVLYATGRGVAKDPARAAQWYRDACIAGASAGCRQFADALRNGRGVTKDEGAAHRAEAREKCLFDVDLEKAAPGSCPSL